MNLSQATNYFSQVSLDGWDGSGWLPSVARVDFQTYDRFISARTFGQNTRTAIAGPGNEIPDQFDYVRTPDQKVYFVLSANSDIDRFGVYNTTYMLKEAPFSASVLKITAYDAPSGLPGTRQETSVADVFCDLERFTSEASSELDLVRYQGFISILPATVPIDTDHELQINGRRYEVREVNPLLRGLEVRSMARGIAPP